MNETISASRLPASFKDPSGFIFKSGGKFYRQVNNSYAGDYDRLMESGLYKELVEKKLLIPHQEATGFPFVSEDGYKILLPDQLNFISYPYEWCFDELKDAALLTLRVLKISLKHGMILKDATPFNIQFQDGSPVFIDSLSFENYDQTEPWIAYRQFCECFFFPLLLENYRQMDVQKLLSVYLDGIPVKTVAKLLPFRSRFKMSIWLHVFLQNSVSSKNKAGASSGNVSFSKQKLVNLIESLRGAIKSLKLNTALQTTWNNYYDETILSKNYLEAKEKLFREMISGINIGRVLDAGCNDGYFSKILSETNPLVVAVDFDSHCVNRLYLEAKSGGIRPILAFCIDLTNPSPALGFNHKERSSFADRAKSELVTALALIHHLVLSKNIPLQDVAFMLAGLTKNFLIIEFVPITDEKSRQLIAQKNDYHKPYDPEAFEKSFIAYFEIENKQTVPDTERILYRMKKRGA
jgi:SAM-dependent methyltransferase